MSKPEYFSNSEWDFSIGWDSGAEKVCMKLKLKGNKGLGVRIEGGKEAKSGRQAVSELPLQTNVKSTQAENGTDRRSLYS